jgi:hypothetical protein
MTPRGVIGAVLMVAGAAGFLFSVWSIAKTGSCASGGVYLSARPCPSSTGLYTGGILAGLFGFLIGAWVFATRGRPATDPGLPPPKDELTANPRPFGSYYPND